MITPRDLAGRGVCVALGVLFGSSHKGGRHHSENDPEPLSRAHALALDQPGHDGPDNGHGDAHRGHHQPRLNLGVGDAPVVDVEADSVDDACSGKDQERPRVDGLREFPAD